MSSVIKITSNPFPKFHTLDIWIGVEIPLSQDEKLQHDLDGFVSIDAHKAIKCLIEKSPEVGNKMMAETVFRATKCIFRKENYKVITQPELDLR